MPTSPIVRAVIRHFLLALSLPASAVFILVLQSLCVPAARAVTLEQWWASAQNHSPIVRATRAQEAAALESSVQAQAVLRPSVDLSVSRSLNQVDQQVAGTAGQVRQQSLNYQSRNETLTLRQPIWRPGASALQKAASATIEQSRAETKFESRQLLEQLAELHLERLLTKTQLDASQMQKARVREQMKAAELAIVAGTGTRTDLDELNVRLHEIEARDMELILRQKQLMARLERLSGLAVSADLFNLETGQSTSAHQRISLLSTMELEADWSWLNLSAELQLLDAQLDELSAQLAQRKAQHSPSLDLVAQLARSDAETVTNPTSGYRNHVLGIQLRMPLYAGGQLTSQVRQLVYQLEAAHARRDERLQELTAQAESFKLTMLSSHERLSALSLAVQAAQLAVHSAQMSLQAGVRSRLDLLAAEQQLSDLAVEQQRTAYQHALAWLRLMNIKDGVNPANIMLFDRVVTGVRP